MGKIVGHWVNYILKQGNPLQKFKITHKYLIFLFYYHFLIKLLIISMSIELIFDSLNFFWINRWVYLGKIIVHWYIYGLKQGNPLQNKKRSQLPNIFILSSFLIEFLIISRSTELIFDSFKNFWSNRWGYLGKKCWPLSQIRNETG